MAVKITNTSLVLLLAAYAVTLILLITLFLSQRFLRTTTKSLNVKITKVANILVWGSSFRPRVFPSNRLRCNGFHE